MVSQEQEQEQAQDGIGIGKSWADSGRDELEVLGDESVPIFGEAGHDCRWVLAAGCWLLGAGMLSTMLLGRTRPSQVEGVSRMLCDNWIKTGLDFRKVSCEVREMVFASAPNPNQQGCTKEGTNGTRDGMARYWYSVAGWSRLVRVDNQVIGSF